METRFRRPFCERMLEVRARGPGGSGRLWRSVNAGGGVGAQLLRLRMGRRLSTPAGPGRWPPCPQPRHQLGQAPRGELHRARPHRPGPHGRFRFRPRFPLPQFSLPAGGRAAHRRHRRFQPGPPGGGPPGAPPPKRGVWVFSSLFEQAASSMAEAVCQAAPTAHRVPSRSRRPGVVSCGLSARRTPVPSRAPPGGRLAVGVTESRIARIQAVRQRPPALFSRPSSSTSRWPAWQQVSTVRHQAGAAPSAGSSSLEQGGCQQHAAPEQAACLQVQWARRGGRIRAGAVRIRAADVFRAAGAQAAPPAAGQLGRRLGPELIQRSGSGVKAFGAGKRARPPLGSTASRSAHLRCKKRRKNRSSHRFGDLLAGDRAETPAAWRDRSSEVVGNCWARLQLGRLPAAAAARALPARLAHHQARTQAVATAAEQGGRQGLRPSPWAGADRHIDGPASGHAAGWPSTRPDPPCCHHQRGPPNMIGNWGRAGSRSGRCSPRQIDVAGTAVGPSPSPDGLAAKMPSARSGRRWGGLAAVSSKVSAPFEHARFFGPVRVVPGWSATIARSRRLRALSRLDFATLGRPTIATLNPSANRLAWPASPPALPTTCALFESCHHAATSRGGGLPVKSTGPPGSP